MGERGIFHRASDFISEQTREHGGSISGGGIMAGGAIVELGTKADVVAVPALVAGTAIMVVSGIVEYADRLIKEISSSE